MLTLPWLPHAVGSFLSTGQLCVDAGALGSPLSTVYLLVDALQGPHHAAVGAVL